MTSKLLTSYTSANYVYKSISRTVRCFSQLNRSLKLAAGNAHPRLARDIAGHLQVPLLDMRCDTFKNGEISVDINESVRDCDVFVVQPTCNPSPNNCVMELLIILDTLRRAGAARITAVMPIYGYARQDRKDKSRAPITAKLVGDMLGCAGVDRIMTIDLHSAQIQGFVNFPFDSTYTLCADQFLWNSLKK